MRCKEPCWNLSISWMGLTREEISKFSWQQIGEGVLRTLFFLVQCNIIYVDYRILLLALKTIYLCCRPTKATNLNEIESNELCHEKF